ncbi:MAG: hypothetical protein MUF00_05355 [Gemmatimonadaceae bacterium]|jgi:hypothetical protein|nr:hypothetical protein [Gemmatimonadaceae bacterium]
MRRSLFAAAAAAVLSLPAVAPAQTVDDVIAKYVEARGGLAKLKAITSLKAVGKMEVGPGIEAPIAMEQTRPANMRMEFTIQGMTAVQAYDGATAWAIVPFQGKKDPDVMPDDQAKSFIEGADFDGALVDWKAKGHTLTLLGKDKVEGSDAWKLKVNLKNGDERIVFLDADSYLEIRNEQKVKMQGTEMETFTNIGDYRDVNGTQMPFSIEQGAKGAPGVQRMTIEKYEANTPIDKTRFTMPKKAN